MSATSFGAVDREGPGKRRPRLPSKPNESDCGSGVIGYI